MAFNSLIFIVFFIAVYLIYRNVGHRLQNPLLLVASYAFYAWWDWRFVGLLATTTVVSYLTGWAIEKSTEVSKRKLYLITSLVINLGILFFFKYFNFFADSFQELAALLGWKLDAFTLKVLLPIGISFYTFQAIGFTVDVYRNRIKPIRSLPDFALYVSFFPQLVAGPIERATNLLPQIQNKRHIDRAAISDGVWLIVLGYTKKCVMADNLAKIVDPIFNGQGPYDSSQVLLAAFAFSFQIYGDFSGYSNIARGLARLMGFKLMVNFRFPYFVSNPSEFWKHWHISLSTWLRDYLYIPLGGNRNGDASTYRNLLLTMLLGGLWHGAAWTFIVWGAYHGILLMAHRFLKSKTVFLNFEFWSKPIAKASTVFAMFTLTMIGWLLFRSQSIGQFFEMISAIVSLHDAAIGEFGIQFATALLVILPVFSIWVIQYVSGRENILEAGGKLKTAAAYLALFYVLTILGDFNQQEFIYFQF